MTYGQKEIVRISANATPNPLEYTIKENARAKHVYLKLSWQSDLEIGVPAGYNRASFWKSSRPSGSGWSVPAHGGGECADIAGRLF
jgi:hypothetical protein